MLHGRMIISLFSIAIISIALTGCDKLIRIFNPPTQTPTITATSTSTPTATFTLTTTATSTYTLTSTVTSTLTPTPTPTKTPLPYVPPTKTLTNTTEPKIENEPPQGEPPWTPPLEMTGE